MKHLLTLALFAAISTSALATKPKPVPTPTPAAGNASAVSAAQASAIAAAVALAVQQQAQKQAQELNARTGDVAVSIPAQERNPVSPAIAPSMNPTTQCALPIVGGVTVASVSLSGGSAYEGEHCQTIEEAKLQYGMGNKATADELACGLPKTRAARLREGRPCSADRNGSAPAAAVKTADYTGSDPIVRARLGLGE